MGLRKNLSVASLLGCVALFLLCAVLKSTSALQRNLESCTFDTDCDTKYCNKKQKTCECFESRDIYTGKKVLQHYDKELGMCFSRVGHSCTLEAAGANQNGLPPVNCIPDATCELLTKSRYSVKLSTQIFGGCSCKQGYQPNKHGDRCISNVELRTDQTPSAMDQVWNRSGSSSYKIIAGKSYTTYFSAFAVIVLCSMFPFR